MPDLIKAIAHLQNETLPIERRLKDVLHGGPLWLDGLGSNIVTGILYITGQKDLYGVWNNRTVDALNKLGYLKERIYNRGKDYRARLLDGLFDECRLKTELIRNL
jgi:hypothetical protein